MGPCKGEGAQLGSGVGLLGAGTVGTAVIELLTDASYAHRFDPGMRPEVIGAVVKDLTKARPNSVSQRWLTTDATALVTHPAVNILIDVMGGEEPALTACLAALRHGKPLITANKQLLASHWDELQDAARAGGTNIFASACTGGAVPMAELIEEALNFDQILSLTGILNGTSNLILQLVTQGHQLDSSVRMAQKLGMAEADPSRDLSGRDALDKAILLSHLAWPEVAVSATLGVGINGSTVAAANQISEHSMQLLPVTICRPRSSDSLKKRQSDVFIEAWSGIAAVATPHPLATLGQRECGLLIETDLAADTFIKGTGAGGTATASAVLSDLCKAVSTDPCRRGRRALPGTPELLRAALHQKEPQKWLVITTGTHREVMTFLEESGLQADIGNSVETGASKRRQDGVADRAVGEDAHNQQAPWSFIVVEKRGRLTLEKAASLSTNSLALLPVIPGRG